MVYVKCERTLSFIINMATSLGTSTHPQVAPFFKQVEGLQQEMLSQKQLRGGREREGCGGSGGE